MKKTIITILTLNFVTLLNASNLSSQEILNMVAKIKQERIGISLATLNGTSQPFIINIPKKKEVIEEIKKHVNSYVPVEVVYTLKAIMNHAAFIDKKWYKKGDKLGEYKVGHVSASSVTLKSSSGNKVLNLEKKKKSFINLNRGSK